MKKDKKIKVGLCFNLKREDSFTDSDEEYDEPVTIEFLTQQLASFGFEVIQFEQNESVFHRLIKEKPLWVMNITEGKGKLRGRESQVPALLEWLNIPYYGSDPIAMGITLDKALTHRFLSQAGIPVPDMFLVRSEQELDTIVSRFIHPRYIVKPRWEGSSKGIFRTSLVTTLKDCRKQAKMILKTYGQPALIEEYIPGEEVTVAVIGNENPQVFGMMKISEKKPKSEAFIYSLEHKRDWQKAINYEKAEAELSGLLIQALEKKALAAFKALELRDVARIDFRVDARAIPRIIDINPLPGLSPEYSDLMLMSGLKGEPFTDVVKKIIRASLTRCQIPEVSYEKRYCCRV